jgi:hypothetical protein
MNRPTDRFRFSAPPRPSLGDELLAGASYAKVFLYRGSGDEPPHCSFEIEGTLPETADVPATVRQIAEHFSAPRREEGGCHG